MGLRLALGAVALGGCRIGRYTLDEPVTDQVLEASSGDRFYLHYEDDRLPRLEWSAWSDDDHISFAYEHEKRVVKDGVLKSPAKVTVIVRVHRGFGGPATVEVEGKDPRTGKIVRSNTLGLYKRTGDSAWWK